MVTPLCKAASYEPCIAILGIWGDTWLTRGKYGINVAVRHSYGALTGSTWRLLPHKISPIYCRVSYVAVTRIPSLVLRNTWHYVIIRNSYGELPKFVLHCSYEAALRKGVTIALIAFLPIFFQVTPPTRRKSSSVLVGNQRVSEMIVTPSYDSPDTLQMPLPPKEQEKKK